MLRMIKRTVSVLLCVFVLASLFSVSITVKAAEFTNSKGTITVTCDGVKKKFYAKNYKKNFSAALNEALNYARKKSTASTPATVTVSKGYYSLDRTIKIYSDTTLVATGCHFRHYGNLLRNGYNKKAKSAVGYSGGKNITIEGGTWDAMVPYSQAGTSNTNIMHSTMRFGHCKNVTVKNCTFVGNYNCHDIEFGGVYKAKVTKCSFSNEYPVNTFPNDGGREAVQIDTATADAMPEFVEYDKTPSTNITVSYNTFKNKYRGVGSHHAVPGKTYNSIKVHHNTFDNIGGIAVYAVYWTNSKIYENTMTNVGLGVDMRQMTNNPDAMNFRNFDSLSYDACEAAVNTSFNYIHSNRIHLRVKDNTYARACGIRVMGDYYGEYDSASNMNAGIYHIYNTIIGQSSYGNIKPNIITGNVAVGIQMNYGVSGVIRGNSIDMSESVSDTANGIEVKGCLDTLVSENTVTNGNLGDSRGILLTPTAAAVRNENVTVIKNTISSCQDAGVFVNKSNNTSTSFNTISSCKTSGLATKASLNSAFSGNNVTGSDDYCAYVYGGSDGTVFMSNTFSDADTGAYVLNSVNTSFKENKFSEIENYGISLRASVADVIADNTVTSGSYAVRLSYGADGALITGNTLSSAETESVYYVGTNDPDKTVEKHFVLTGNTFSSAAVLPDIRLANANVVAEIFDNKTDDGAEVTIRAKGISDKNYRTMSGQTALDTLSAEKTEEGTLLGWTTSDDVNGFRISTVSEGLRKFVADTYEITYTVPASESGVYEVSPYNSFSEIKVLGAPLSVTV